MNNLTSAIMAMRKFKTTMMDVAAAIASKKKDTDSSKRQMTKRGVTHVQGRGFRPKHIIKVQNKFGSASFVSPAMYRRLHLGRVKRAQNGS